MYQPPVRSLVYESAQQSSHKLNQIQGDGEQQQLDSPQQNRYNIQRRRKLIRNAPQRPVLQPAWPKELLPQHVQQPSDPTQEVLLEALTLDEAQAHDAPSEQTIDLNDRRDRDVLPARAAKASATDLSTSVPKPQSRPEVWADSRQELCETLQYFRAYHGGSYTTGGFARGFLFDKSAHARDYMDSTVVIARAGGGLVKDKDTGERVIGSDRTEDSRVASLRNSMQYLNPVVIITGADNPNVPTKPPHAYCVLDYFKPTHIWSEKSKGKIILRYRFEKLDATKPSWWAQDQIHPGSVGPPSVHTCATCKHESQQIYLQGWMCLKPTCSMFWLMAPTSGNPVPHEPVEAELKYDPCFLKQRVQWPNEKHIYSLSSNNVELSGLSVVGEDCSLAYWLGMVCPQCGKCNSRLSWTGWECGNTSEGCTWKREPPHVLIPSQSLRDPFFPLTSGYTLSRDTHLPLVTLDVSFRNNYRINKYIIPGVDGFVVHLIANKTVVEEEGGPDQMFEELQQEDIGLRRRGLGSGMLKGESYTRHFLVNYGMPYKFIAATASRSFDGAARPINHTRTRLNWAAKSVLAETAVRLISKASTEKEAAKTAAEAVRQNIEQGWKEREFNEVLALGYFEQQRINYHDDGEFGLGPTIATLSLGAPGTMRLRMKARHYNGVSTAGVYDAAPPLPGCTAYEARHAAQSSLSTLQATNPAAYRARLKTLPKELKLKSGSTARDAMTLHLAHGDIVIMHGAQMQKYYEHSVDHAGKLRFALTCRYIEPGSLKEADRPDYEVGPDEGVYDGTELPAAA
jgi:alkylated DNA repair dioxygenase AlkB